MKITPGPWKVTNGYYDIVTDDGSIDIAMVAFNPSSAAYQANARAIAEVPAMIEYIQRVINAHSPSCTSDLVKTAKAILSRIEGSDKP